MLAFASVPLMIPIALATDYLTEKAWSCDTHVWINNSSESTNRRKTCHRYFILPPHESNRIHAFIRLEEWMRQVKDDFSECSSFVETDKILRIHGEFHLGIHKKFLYRKIRRFTKLKIAEMTNADVIVVLNKTKAVDNSSTKFITAEFYDIHNDKKLTPKELGLEELPKVAVERDSKNIQDIWDLLFQFELPNTILVGSSITRFSAVSSSNQTESSSQKPTADINETPFEFTHARNYSTYPLYYSSLKPSLDLGFSFFNFSKNEQFETKESFVARRYIYGTYGPKLRIHTDFGVHSLYLGFGPALISSIINSKTKLEFTIKSSIKLRSEFQLTDKAFLFAAAEHSDFNRKLTAGNYELNRFTRFSAGLGWLLY